jgi:hypothetical protein
MRKQVGHRLVSQKFGKTCVHFMVNAFVQSPSVLYLELSMADVTSLDTSDTRLLRFRLR